MDTLFFHDVPLLTDLDVKYSYDSYEHFIEIEQVLWDDTDITHLLSDKVIDYLINAVNEEMEAGGEP